VIEKSGVYGYEGKRGNGEKSGAKRKYTGIGNVAGGKEVFWDRLFFSNLLAD
jgi:hypothetical protein